MPHARDNTTTTALLPMGTGPAALILETLERRVLWAVTPNDPAYLEQWGLQSIDADEAWETSTGSANTVVAVLDSGIDYTHEDLYLNVWINQKEIPPAVEQQLTDTDGDGLYTFYDLNAPVNAGLVNDGNANGYIDAADLLRRYKPDGSGGWEDGVNGETYDGDPHVDDIVGWDFAGNDNDPLDGNGHGTHVSGIIGATGNNGVGVAGVNWEVSLMPVQIFDETGASTDDAAIASAIRYAVDAGAPVSNNSWGSPRYSAAIDDAVSYANDNGHLFVTGAGNKGNNNDLPWSPFYPAGHDRENVIAVAATTESGTRAYYSNYGATTVDIAAPGDDIVSTWLNNTYQSASGTSMATPFVTGAIALMLSENPSLTMSEARARLVDAAEESSALFDISASRGELELDDALIDESDTDLPVAADSTAPVVDRLLPWLRRAFDLDSDALFARAASHADAFHG